MPRPKTNSHRVGAESVRAALADLDQRENVPIRMPPTIASRIPFQVAARFAAASALSPAALRLTASAR